MRMLERNKRKIWKQSKLTEKPILDENGFMTGEYEHEYTEPIMILANIMPSNSKVERQSFGILLNLDVIVVSDIKLFDVDDLIYDTEPTVDSLPTHRVSKIAHSLNSYTFGLEMV